VCIVSKFRSSESGGFGSDEMSLFSLHRNFNCARDNPLQPGDTLIVWKLDRLGRSLRDLITMLDDLRFRGVKFRSLTEAIDTESPIGRAMWQMIGVMAEFERSIIGERTRAGVKAAKARGVKFGRRRALTPQQIEHAKELRPKRSPDEIAVLLGVSRATVYRVFD
jgi:DNA invertase Pin-like site-specific DNA recombinase